MANTRLNIDAKIIFKSECDQFKQVWHSRIINIYNYEIYIPTGAVSCKNVHCSDENHIYAINKLYSDIVNSLIQPGEQIMQKNKKKYTHKPGWAEYVDNCMIPLEKLDNCGLMQANPDRDLYMTCM